MRLKEKPRRASSVITELASPPRSTLWMARALDAQPATAMTSGIRRSCSASILIVSRLMSPPVGVPSCASRIEHTSAAAFLDGEREPNRPGAQGILSGLTSATDREDIARAAFEGVILGLVSGERRLNAAGVRTGGRLIATGGGARSAAYTQLLADLTGREVLVADAPEASARGACVQAAAIASDRPVREVLRAWAPATRSVATPRPGSGTVRETAADRYAVLAGWDALDTPATDSPGTTA